MDLSVEAANNDCATRGRRSGMTRFLSTINCECCKLRQQAWAIPGEPTSTCCKVCSEHRGVNEVDKRALAHEAMLRERLGAARTAADDALRDRDRYKGKMHHAYEARERALRLVMRVRYLHTMTGNGSCTCGTKRGCRSAELLQEPWVSRQLAIIERIDLEDELARGTPQRSEWLVDTWDDLDRTARQAGPSPFGQSEQSG